MMYKPKLEKDIRCPLEYGLGIFGGKWKSRIICVLAAAGKAASNVNVDHGVVFSGQGAERVLIVGGVDRVGGGDFASGLHMGGDVRRADVHAVVIELSGLDDAEWKDGDIVLLQQLFGQVARAVCRDFDHKGLLPLSRHPGTIFKFPPQGGKANLLYHRSF